MVFRHTKIKIFFVCGSEFSFFIALVSEKVVSEKCKTVCAAYVIWIKFLKYGFDLSICCHDYA